MRKLDQEDLDVLKNIEELSVKDRVHVFHQQREFFNSCVSLEGKKPWFIDRPVRIIVIEEG